MYVWRERERESERERERERKSEMAETRTYRAVTVPFFCETSLLFCFVLHIRETVTEPSNHLGFSTLLKPGQLLDVTSSNCFPRSSDLRWCRLVV